MLHLQKHLLPLLRSASHSTLSSSLHLLLPLCTSTFATPLFIDDYLVAAYGLTGAQVLKASRKLSHLKSASNPDSVLALLSGVGLSRPDSAADPLLLRSRVDNVARRLASLRDRVGLFDPQITRFILVGGAVALRSCDVAPWLELWIPFFGSFDELLQTVRRNRSILVYDLEMLTLQLVLGNGSPKSIFE